MAFGRSQLNRSSFDVQQDDDACADLITALTAAEACKEFLRCRQHTEALVCFIKALAHSVHCVGCLQEGVSALVEAIDFLEQDHKNIFARLGKPLVLQASTLLLIGQHLQSLPSPGRAMEVFEQDTWSDPTYEMLAVGFHLEIQDIHWAIYLGRFKTAFRMVTQNGYLQNSNDKHSCQDHLETSVQQLYNLRPDHPATYEAISLLVQYHSTKPCPLDDAMLTLDRTLSGAFLIHHDPAAAMHYLLHAMYTTLLACYGQPSSNIKCALQTIANHWIELLNMLRSRNVEPHGNLWLQVADRMQAALLLLGRAFPLDQCLDGHIFAQFVQDLHRTLQHERELLNSHEKSASDEQAEGQPEESKKEVVQPYSNRTACCSRCEKKMGKAYTESNRLFTCTSCNSDYCRQYCQDKDHACNRPTCKPHHLRNKLKKRRRLIWSGSGLS